MKKKELVAAIREKSGLAKNQSEVALNAVIECLTDLLSKGNSIILPGFVSLSVKKREARAGRNPSTGKPINIPARKVVSFKAGLKLKERVNA